MSTCSLPRPYPECRLRSEGQPFLVLGYEKLECNYQGLKGLRVGIIRIVDCDEPATLLGLLAFKKLVGLVPVKSSCYPCAIDFIEALRALVACNPLYAGRGYILTHMPGEGFIKYPLGIKYAFDFATGGIHFGNREPSPLPKAIPLGYDVIMGYEV